MKKSDIANELKEVIRSNVNTLNSESIHIIQNAIKQLEKPELTTKDLKDILILLMKILFTTGDNGFPD